MRIFEDVKYAEGYEPSRSLSVFLPDGEFSTVVLYFHGGGFQDGSYKDYGAEHPFVRDLVDAGYGVISAEYRMYPSARFPDFIEDGALAVKFVKEHFKDEHGKKLVVGGSSAGGYLTQMLCFDRRYLDAVGVKHDDIDAYVHDAGQTTVHFNVLKERGTDYRRVIIDESAPLYHVGLMESYPPMQLIYSDNDIPNRPEQTELLLGTLRHFGYDMSKVRVDKTRGSHVWYVDKADSDGRSEFAKLVIPFIKSVI